MLYKCLTNIFKNEIFKLVIKNKESKEYLNKCQAILRMYISLYFSKHVGNIIITNTSQ